jgi:predicted small lipoprotein YifL
MAERMPTRGLAWLSLALLAGCGQKGPLYLPDEARGIVTRPAPPTTAPGETQQSPSTPATPDSPQGPANPAPEVTPPDTDKDKKAPGAKPPRS